MKDLFSTQADVYKKFRPVYPQALYDYVLSFTSGRDCAPDVATGNGQAAVVLANFFKTVYATDISSAQLQHAEQKENIRYVQSAAEQTTFEPNTFDLITAAQAYHWLQHEAFANEIKRIAKHGAVIAVWMYDRFQTSKAALNELMDRFYVDITGPYWDAARKHVDQHYTDLPFPFTPLPTRSFAIEAEWTQAEILGYLSSWSAVQQYQKVNGTSPLSLIQNDLHKILSTASVAVQFPIYMQLGRVE